MRLGPNPYADWTPPSPPWKMCYSSAFQGNDWRVAGLQRRPEHGRAVARPGLIDGDLITADANNNASVQANQINNMVQQGCQVIFVMQPPAIGLCQAFDSAAQQGVLVMVMQTGTQCTSGDPLGFLRVPGRFADRAVDRGHQHRRGRERGDLRGHPGRARRPTPGWRRPPTCSARIPASHVDASPASGRRPSPSPPCSNCWPPTSSRSTAYWNGGSCQVGTGEALLQAGRPLKNVAGLRGSCAGSAFWKDEPPATRSRSRKADTGRVRAVRAGDAHAGRAEPCGQLVHLSAADDHLGKLRPVLPSDDDRAEHVQRAAAVGGVPVPGQLLTTRLLHGGGTPVQITYPQLS